MSKKKLEDLIEEALWLRGGLRELDVCTSRKFKKVDSYETLADYCKDQVKKLRVIIKALLVIRDEAEEEMS